MYHEFFPKVPNLESSNDNIINDSWRKNRQIIFQTKHTMLARKAQKP